MREKEAQRLAEAQEKEGHSLTIANHNNKEDDDADKEKVTEVVDLLNFHVKELREPNYKELSPEKLANTTPQPHVDYTRTYLPNG